MKVALVHDYLKEYGGAERVLEALHEIFPNASLFTAYYNPQSLGENNKRFRDWDIRTSWFQKFPLAGRLISPFRLFAQMMFESFDLGEYDLVISSSAIYSAKAVITKPETLHIGYIHTPPRFLYGYATSFNYKKNPITRVLGEVANHILRIYDFEISQRPDILVANSQNVQKRIKKFYRRDSVVIYPPVDFSVIPSKTRNLPTSEDSSLIVQNDKRKKSYYLVLSRLVRGKGVEAVVEACDKLGLPLKVAGTGPELKNLKSRILNHKSNIEFLGWVSDEARVKLLVNAKALVVASEDEDFGITSIEAQAVGTPVIAPASGGFLETVVDGKTGILYPVTKNGTAVTNFVNGVDQDMLEGLIEVLQKFDPAKLDPEDCRRNAEKFSKERFKKEILQLVEKNLKS